DGGFAQHLCGRGNARGSRSRYRGYPRGPSQRAPRAGHCQRSHGRSPRRPQPENHGERARRAVAAQREPQPDGGLAERIRRRSDPRGPRSGHRRQARWPSQRTRCERYLERLDR
nr:hypothetical protein [Tanacetum cinerariifolium]